MDGLKIWLVDFNYLFTVITIITITDPVPSVSSLLQLHLKRQIQKNKNSRFLFWSSAF